MRCSGKPTFKVASRRAPNGQMQPLACSGKFSQRSATAMYGGCYDSFERFRG
jgi:hypothetical protein